MARKAATPMKTAMMSSVPECCLPALGDLSALTNLCLMKPFPTNSSSFSVRHLSEDISVSDVSHLYMTWYNECLVFAGQLLSVAKYENPLLHRLIYMPAGRTHHICQHKRVAYILAGACERQMSSRSE